MFEMTPYMFQTGLFSRAPPCRTFSMFLVYRSLAPATAVRLLASAVAWTTGGKKTKNSQGGSENNMRNSRNSGGNQPAALTLDEAAPPLDRSLYRPVGKTSTSTSALQAQFLMTNSFIFDIKEMPQTLRKQ